MAARWLLLLFLSLGSTAPTWAQTHFPPDTNPQYFPTGVFGKMSDFLADWYSSYLRVMGEPSFLDLSKDRSVVAYRFIWLRTFHHPIAIRISIRPDGSASLIGKVTSGAGGYEPGSLTWNESFEISKQQVQLFLRLLNKTAFWSAPTEQSNGGMDGAEWIMEGVEHGKYHVEDRWTPRQGDYVDMCLYLVNLSKIQLGAKEIY